MLDGKFIVTYSSRFLKKNEIGETKAGQEEREIWENAKKEELEIRKERKQHEGEMVEQTEQHKRDKILVRK